MHDYLEAVRQAYRGERIGELLYRRLSESYRDVAQRQKLARIADVEGRTHRILEPIAQRLGIKLADGDIRTSVEQRLSELELLEWPAFIEQALVNWPPYIEMFETLARLAPADDAAAAREVVHHEIALVEFARRERSGRSDSGAPLEAFCKPQSS